MKKSFWQSSVFRFWLVCYLLVLGIPMIFSAVAQHRMFEDLKKRTYDQSVSAVEQLASTVDEQWKALFRISDAICSSSRMCKLRGVSLPYNAERFYEVHSRASALADYSVNSLTISGLYIYSANLNSLLDAGHIYQQGMQLNTASRKYLGLEPEDLFELTSTRRLHDLIVTADGKLLLLQTFSTGFSEPVPPLTLILVVKLHEMEAIAKNVAAPWEGSSYMLLSADMIQAPDQENTKGLIQPDTLLNTLESNTDDIIASTASRIAPVTYVLSISNDRLYHDLFSTRTLIAYFFGCTLLLGLLLAYFLARHNYRPLHELKETTGISLAGNSSEDEYRAIRRHLLDAKSDHDQMQQEIHRLELIENKQIFQELLTGETSSTDFSDSSALQSIYRDLEGKQIVAMLFEYDREAEGAPNRKTMIALLQKALDDVCQGACQSYVYRVGSDLSGILCFHGDMDPYDAQFFAKKTIKKMLEEKLLQNVSVYIGDTHRDCVGVRLSYQEAVRARDYAVFVAETENPVVVYDKTMYSTNVSWEHFDIVDAERRFITLLLKGNYTACEELFSKIMTYYTGHEGVSLYVMRCRMYSIINMILHVLQEIEPDVGDAIYNDGHTIEQLLTARTMRELEDAVQRIFLALRKKNEKAPVQRDQKMERVEQYILANYSDPLLSVQQVADHFEMSLPYLSREFKNSRGMGVLSYINACRIAKAKELLLNFGNATVSEVAEAVGYNSSQTLIRIFKRYEQITPGQFRQEQYADANAAHV